jgi:hypothetical protein
MTLTRCGSALILALCCGVASACGGSSHSASRTSQAKVPVAQRVCGLAQRAAGNVQGGQVHLRIANPDPANVECVLSRDGIHLDVNAQASPVAWTQYDTTVVHQAQAFGPGSVHDASALPQPVPGMSGNAAWLPTEHQLVTTNGTETQGGSYVTVTVKRSSQHGPASVPLARAVAIATLASAPRGPTP